MKIAKMKIKIQIKTIFFEQYIEKPRRRRLSKKINFKIEIMKIRRFFQWFPLESINFSRQVLNVCQNFEGKKFLDGRLI